jgi:translation initiation factor IF-2
MFDDHERPIKEATPAMATEILGLSDVPEAGEKFYVVDDEKKAREMALKRQEQLKLQKMQPSSKITLEDIYTQIQEGKIKELNIVLKADVQGSLEAMRDSLSKLSNEEVQLRFVHVGVGDISASDVILAQASEAIVIGFNIAIGTRAQEELEKQPVDVRTYRIIYDAVNDVKNALAGLLEPKTKKKFLGKVEVRQVFNLSKAGTVAGCFVAKGRVHRKVNVDVIRNGSVVFSGTISSLKRFKDDVREVNEGFECGITLNGFSDIQVGDVIEAYELEKIARTL